MIVSCARSLFWWADNTPSLRRGPNFGSRSPQHPLSLAIHKVSIHKGAIVNLDHYTKLLTAKEHELTARRGRSGMEEQESGDGAMPATWATTASGRTESRSCLPRTKRIFHVRSTRFAWRSVESRMVPGRCLVDEQPIEEKAARGRSWAKFCTKHQAELEADSGYPHPSPVENPTCRKWSDR